MTDTISVRFDKQLQKDLSKIEKKWKTDRSEAIRRLLAKAINEWKIGNCLEDIRENRTSIGKAAEECEISIWEFLDLLKEKNIDWIEYSKEDLERDLALIE